MKLHVTLQHSDNNYLTYPCTGILEIIEVSVYGRVIYATFRVESDEPSRINCKVCVDNPKFSYSGKVAA